MAVQGTEIVGYDVVQLFYEEVGDTETGPMLQENAMSVLDHDDNIIVVIGNEEVEFPGVNEQKAVQVVAELRNKFPNKEFEIVPITMEECEYSYYCSCIEAEIQE